MKRSTSLKTMAIKMQSTSALRQALKPSVFIFFLFIIFSLIRGGHIVQALGFIWLVRVFEIPVGSRHESCTCQCRLVFDLHCANPVEIVSGHHSPSLSEPIPECWLE